MSGTDPAGGGSAYGLQYYGRGPYGFATRIMGIWGSTRAHLKPQLIAQAQLPIVSAPFVAFGGTVMWAAIDVPPCEPWEVIGTPGCWQARPNSAGGMFG